MHRRLGLFLRVLSDRFEHIAMLHIVPPELMSRGEDAHTLSREQSEFWGVPLRVHLIARRIRHESLWSYYGAGIFRTAEQPIYRSYGGTALAEGIARHLRTAPDFILVDRLEAMLPLLRSGCRTSRLLFDLNDVEHKPRFTSARSEQNLFQRFAALMQIPTLIVAERSAVRRSSAAMICSEVDRAHLRRLGFGPKVKVVPNAVVLPPNPPGLVLDPTILFLGACNYQPNSDAAERLARRIWPLIREYVPNARLILAGKSTDRLPSRADGIEGVEYRGFVPDLAALYAETRLVCCPLLNGGGTRLKLVEAAAHARPMVSTRAGAEGLDFEDGAAILLRETDREIADACIHLLRDDAACLRLGVAGRDTMARHYDRILIEQQVAGLISAIVGNETADSAARRLDRVENRW